MRPANWVKICPNHALAAIAIDDALIEYEIRRCLGQHALRYAGGDRLLFQIGQKAIERQAVVAGRRALRRCGGWPR